MSLFSKLFGGAAAAPPEPELYKGFAIRPTPQKDSSGWRIAARIEKDGQGHDLIRADVLNTKEAAEEASLSKAKQVIDEQGARLFR
jgi:hypothetical protein